MKGRLLNAAPFADLKTSTRPRLDRQVVRLAPAQNESSADQHHPDQEQRRRRRFRSRARTSTIVRAARRRRPVARKAGAGGIRRKCHVCSDVSAIAVGGEQLGNTRQSMVRNVERKCKAGTWARKPRTVVQGEIHHAKPVHLGSTRWGGSQRQTCTAEIANRAGRAAEIK